LQRVLSTATLLGLLVATAAAFAITEHLKLIRSPVYGARVSKVVSPVCHCQESKAIIRVRLRHADTVTVTIQDAGRHTVATLAADRHEPRSQPVYFTWNGRTDSGAVAPDGVYQPQIQLENRTILFPNRIVVDTKPPTVVSASIKHHVFTPGGKRTVAIHYAFDGRAHAVVYLRGQLLIRGRPSRASGTVKWAGKVGGESVRPGIYALSIGAVDDAGNVTPAAGRKQVTVIVRYLDLVPHVVRVRAGARFAVVVETGAPKYTWRLGKRQGSGRKALLKLTAPGAKGTYRLVVAEHGHTATALVRVRGK
jgi:FlgD Ig-like domain